MISQLKDTSCGDVVSATNVLTCMEALAATATTAFVFMSWMASAENDRYVSPRAVARPGIALMAFMSAIPIDTTMLVPSALDVPLTAACST